MHQFDNENQIINDIENNKFQAIATEKKSRLLNSFSTAKITGNIKTKPISLRLKEPTLLSLKKHISRYWNSLSNYFISTS